MVNRSLDIIRRVYDGTSPLGIAFSGGKDAVATLDIAKQVTDHIVCFYMYLVKGLSFMDKYNDYISNKYNVEILQYPHYDLNKMLRGSYCIDYKSYIPNITIHTIENAFRHDTKADWIAYGYKSSDSVRRRGYMMKWEHKNTFTKYKRIAPLEHWTNPQVYSYIKFRNIKLPETFGIKNNFGISLEPDVLMGMKKYYPEDYQKVLDVFPFAEVAIQRELMYGKQNK